MATNKRCACSAKFDEAREVCTACGKSKLDFAESASGKQLTVLHESLPFLSEAQNRKRRKIEAEIKEKANSKRLHEAYKALGLTEEESRLASMVEARLTSEDIDILNLNFSK